MSHKNKVLFVLFGSDELISDFQEIHNHFNSENSINLSSLDNLGEQIEFILDDSQFNTKDTIFVTINSYDKEKFEYILEETKDILGLILKFVVLNDKEKKNDEEILELVTAIDDFSDSLKSGKNKNFHLPNDSDDIYESLNDINVLAMNLDNLSFIVDICLISYGVNSISELPHDVKQELNTSILKSVKKYNDSI